MMTTKHIGVAKGALARNGIGVGSEAVRGKSSQWSLRCVTV
jgi:hypothetical protein